MLTPGLTIACPCGSVRITAPRPGFVHACNCTACTGADAHWGYYDPAEVTVAGDTTGRRRADKPDPAADLRACAECGTTTHFVLTENAVARFGNTMMGVNLRLADPSDLAGVELRYPDGLAWSGEGPFTYVRPPRIIGAD